MLSISRQSLNILTIHKFPFLKIFQKEIDPDFRKTD